MIALIKGLCSVVLFVVFVFIMTAMCVSIAEMPPAG